MFIIGFHKTGTTSVSKALTILGYKVHSGGFRYRKDKFPKLINLLDTYDAVEDMPWPLYYKELADSFPNAKFILTYRSTESWIKGMKSHFGFVNRPKQQLIYGVGRVMGNEQIYIQRYESFNAEVREFFKGQGKLLELRTGVDFKWEIICNFLNQPIPDAAFPHANKTPKENRFTIVRMVKDIMKNTFK